jgi:hypothetical protein
MKDKEEKKMAIKKKAATKKEAKKEVKTRDFHAIGDNKNDLKMVVYGEGSEAGDYISYFALLIINGLQVSGTLKLSTVEEKNSFFSWPAYGKKKEDGSTEWIKQVSIKDDGLKEDVDNFILLVEGAIDYNN